MPNLTDLRTLVLFVVTFTAIVAVHEAGHFISARLLGMKVLEFAFGFPPRAFGLVHAGIAYTVNWIPFGGFVRILGQDDFAIRQEGEGDPRSFTSRPWWAQAIVLAAGVCMNMVLALVVLTFAFALGTTQPTGEVRIREVASGSPAALADIRPGDLVVSMDGQAVRSTRDVITYTSAHAGDEIAIALRRGDQTVGPVRVVPRTQPPQGEGALGVRVEDVLAPVSLPIPVAVGEAVAFTGTVLQQIAALPGQLFGGAAPPGQEPQVGGPIEIFRVTGLVADFGLAAFLQLVGVLSINLAVLNILPFPGLDGGRLFFVLIGGIFRRRLAPEVEAAIHAVGFVLLLTLLVAVSISDVRRVIGG